MFRKPYFRTFQSFSKLFRTFSELFRIFSVLFDPKTGVFDSKTQTLRSFFLIFKIDVQFWLISELFFQTYISKLFSKHFAKILRVQKFCFFSKKFQTLTAKHFRKSRRQKVRKIPSNAGP
jgi:hypothetical protein